MHDHSGMFYLYTGLKPPPEQKLALQRPVAVDTTWIAAGRSMIAARTDVMSSGVRQHELASGELSGRPS
eukprot:13634333-Heterocapsa_arctica.AAC.1